jgi:cytochrome c biogenesis protein CcmG/thiol:disulfide interchange protein DsbE
MRLLIVVAIVAGLGGIFVWGTLRGDDPMPSAIADTPAPDFTLPVLEPYRAQWGEALRLSDHAGDFPIILNFWASWCPPCRDEAPMLEAFWKRYQDQVLLIGINVQDGEANALAFIREFGLTFPSVFDPRSRAGIDYGMYGLPETFFIDREGQVLARHVGYLSADQLAGYLEQLQVDAPAALGTAGAVGNP